MPKIKNQRHELFAQALARGEATGAAYKSAGYSEHPGNAHRLSKKENVQRRVAEIQSRGAKRAEVTIETIAAELEEARSKAMANDQISAAVSASMGKAKLFGLLIEKRQHSGAIGTYDLSKLSDGDIERLEAILGPLADTGGDPGGEGEA